MIRRLLCAVYNLLARDAELGFHLLYQLCKLLLTLFFGVGVNIFPEKHIFLQSVSFAVKNERSSADC